MQIADRLLTIPEAATELGVSAQRVRRLAARGRIVGAVKCGRDWLIPAPVRVTPGKPGRPARREAP